MKYPRYLSLGLDFKNKIPYYFFRNRNPIFSLIFGERLINRLFIVVFVVIVFSVPTTTRSETAEVPKKILRFGVGYNIQSDSIILGEKLERLNTNIEPTSNITNFPDECFKNTGVESVTGRKIKNDFHDLIKRHFVSDIPVALHCDHNIIPAHVYIEGWIKDKKKWYILNNPSSNVGVAILGDWMLNNNIENDSNKIEQKVTNGSRGIHISNKSGEKIIILGINKKSLLMINVFAKQAEKDAFDHVLKLANIEYMSGKDPYRTGFVISKIDYEHLASSFNTSLLAMGHYKYVRASVKTYLLEQEIGFPEEPNFYSKQSIKLKNGIAESEKLFNELLRKSNNLD